MLLYGGYAFKESDRGGGGRQTQKFRVEQLETIIYIRVFYIHVIIFTQT